MANTILTPTWITKEAVSMFVNTCAFLQQIDRQFDAQFQQEFKIGNSLQIRLPVSYVPGTSWTVTPQDTVEQFTTLTVGQVRNITTAWTDQDFTLYIDEFRDRYLKNMINTLANAVALDVMSLAEKVPNFVSNVDGSSNIIAPTEDTFLNGSQILTDRSADFMDRQVTISPKTNRSVISSLAGLFNPTQAIASQFKSGNMTGMMAFGLEGWRQDQTILSHTTGTGTSMTVNGASQTGTSLIINATGTLKAGDIITIVGVNACNRLTGQDLGYLAQFVVLANVSGNSTLSIFPAIVPSLGGTVQYQTVVTGPANSAVINFVSKPSEVYRKNLIYKPDAFTLVTADLPIVKTGVVACARERFDGISMRYLRGYNVLTATYTDRLDILYGYAMPKQDWACVVADKL